MTNHNYEALRLAVDRLAEVQQLTEPWSKP